MTEGAALSRPQILTVTKLPPFLLEPLNDAFVVHDCLHQSDPAAFAKIAPEVRQARLVVVLHGRTAVQPDDIVKLGIAAGKALVFDGASGNRLD